MTNPTSAPPATASGALQAGLPKARLPALDALRGFDMFWLIGGELLPASLTLSGAAIAHDALVLSFAGSQVSLSGGGFTSKGSCV